MQRIVTAAAALALVAGAAQAQSQGNPDRKGHDKPAAAAKAGGGQGQGKGRERDDGRSMARAARDGGAPGPGNGDPARGADRNDDRRQGSARPAPVRVERVTDRDRADRPVVVDRNRDAVRPVVVDRDRVNVDRVVLVDDRGRYRSPDRRYVALAPRRVIVGCPPGLAKKRNGCQPPGQAKKNVAWSSYRPDWWGVRGIDDGRYFYRDGYLLRLDGPRVGGFVPLLGGALGIGNAWPGFYEPVRLPTYYERYYALGPYSSYRYADNVVYRVDPETAAITSIAALLTGDDFAVGQPVPLGYDVYNVPYAYRTQYADSPSAMYRYSDGYVYQIDPATRLVAAAIELIAT